MNEYTERKNNVQLQRSVHLYEQLLCNYLDTIRTYNQVLYGGLGNPV